MGAFKRLKEHMDERGQKDAVEAEEVVRAYLDLLHKKLIESADRAAMDEYAEYMAEMEDNFDDYYNDSEYLKERV